MASDDYYAKEAIKKTNDAVRSLIGVLPGMHDLTERLLDESDVLADNIDTPRGRPRVVNAVDDLRDKRAREGS